MGFLIECINARPPFLNAKLPPQPLPPRDSTTELRFQRRLERGQQELQSRAKTRSAAGNGPKFVMLFMKLTGVAAGACRAAKQAYPGVSSTTLSVGSCLIRLLERPRQQS